MDILTSILWLTLNVYHEARSEDQLSQIAIAHVTLNRSYQSNTQIKQVVLKDKQFSWVHQKYDYYPYDTQALIECLESVFIALRGYDFTKGSTYYHKKSIKPYWASWNQLEYIGTFGSHKFYKNK
jgi:N-acetylmuramoyl-L-alanine amidase